MKNRVDPEGARLPVKLDTTANGEFPPVPLTGGTRCIGRHRPGAA